MFKGLFRKVFNSTTSKMSVDELLRLIWTANQASSGVSVTAETAMRCSTVFSCVRLLSESVAQLPAKLISLDKDGKRSPASSDPLYYVLLHSPNKWMSAFLYWQFNMSCLLLKGFFISQIIRSGNGKIMQLIPIHPDNVHEIKQAPDGSLIFICMINNAERIFMQSEVFYCYYTTLDGLTPISPINYNKESIGLAMVAEKHGALTFKNAARPSGVIQVPQRLSDEAFKHMKESWAEAYGGENTGKPAILEENSVFNPVTMSNEEAQYLDTRRFQKQDICGIFGVPPHMIGDTTQAKGWSTMEQMMTEFVTLSLNPWTVRIEQAIRLCLIPEIEWGNRYVKFLTTGLLRGDAAARANFYNAGIDKRWLTPNEAREREDMNPIEGGDDFKNQASSSKASDPQKADSNKDAKNE